jgi:uncharacterized protein
MKGQFVWYELLTTDPKAAIAFYGEVLGWKTQPFEGAGAYRLWVSSQGPVGGVMSRDEAATHEPGIDGTPPRWTAHVAVESVDQSCASVRKLGGKVLFGPSDIPSVGRFAVIADPLGGSLAVFTPKPGSKPMPPHDDKKPGEFTWHELITSDLEAAFRFYSQLFGWQKRREVPMGADGMYLVYGTAEKDLGGIFAPKREALPGWYYYATTEDIDAALARVKARGGKVLNGPMDVPGGDRVAQATDPQGAIFALLEWKKK